MRPLSFSPEIGRQIDPVPGDLPKSPVE